MSLTSPTDTPCPTRQRILDCAERLFAQQGITPVGVNDVARDLNTGPAQVTSVFPSKETLVEAVLDARHKAWMTRLETSVAAYEFPVDRVLSIFTFLEEWFAEETFHRCAFVTSYGELGPATGWVSDMIRRHKTAFEIFVAALATEAELPTTIAASIVLLAEGAQAAAAATQTPAPARDARTSAALLIAVYQSEPTDIDL